MVLAVYNFVFRVTGESLKRHFDFINFPKNKSWQSPRNNSINSETIFNIRMGNYIITQKTKIIRLIINCLDNSEFIFDEGCSIQKCIIFFISRFYFYLRLILNYYKLMKLYNLIAIMSQLLSKENECNKDCVNDWRPLFTMYICIHKVVLRTLWNFHVHKDIDSKVIKSYSRNYICRRKGRHHSNTSKNG